jgi:hypothetical protein
VVFAGDWYKHYTSIAEELMKNEEYDAARENYRLSLIFAEDEETRKQSLLGLGKSSVLSENYNEAAKWFSELPASEERTFALGLAHYLLREYNLCDAQFAIIPDESPFADDASILGVFSCLKRYQWNLAASRAQELAKDSKYGICASVLDSELARPGALRKKNPALAITLSFIPGLGQLYTGHWQEALASAFINDALAYACYDSFRKANEIDKYGYTDFVVWCGVLSVFYTGNLYGAGLSAIRHNRKQDSNLLERISSELYKRGIDIKMLPPRIVLQL